MDICQKSEINSNHINETDFSNKVNSEINKDNKIMVPVMVEIDDDDVSGPSSIPDKPVITTIVPSIATVQSTSVVKKYDSSSTFYECSSVLPASDHSKATNSGDVLSEPISEEKNISQY